MKLEKDKIYTGKQLAEWFGITADSFRNNKKKKMEELKVFADYELIGGKQKKVLIKEVYNPVYSKQGSESYQITKSKINEVWDESGLDSCKRVSAVIYNSKEYWPVTKDTVYNYTLRGRNELYGRPYGEPGSIGRCIYTWCKKDGEDENAKLIPLTPEEEEIKQNLIKKYFGDATEKQIIVKGMVMAGEITKEEAWGVLEELTNMKGEGNFMAFLTELQEKLHCKIIKGTLVEEIERGIDFRE